MAVVEIKIADEISEGVVTKLSAIAAHASKGFEAVEKLKAALRSIDANSANELKNSFSGVAEVMNKSATASMQLGEAQAKLASVEAQTALQQEKLNQVRSKSAVEAVKVAVAEEKLNQARSKSAVEASKAVLEEDKLSRSRAKAEIEAAKQLVAEEKLTQAVNKTAAEASKAAISAEKLTQARSKTELEAAKQLMAEEKLNQAVSKSAVEAAKAEVASEKLAQARSKTAIEAAKELAAEDKLNQSVSKTTAEAAKAAIAEEKLVQARNKTAEQAINRIALEERAKQAKSKTTQETIKESIAEQKLVQARLNSERSAVQLSLAQERLIQSTARSSQAIDKASLGMKKYRFSIVTLARQTAILLGASYSIARIAKAADGYRILSNKLQEVSYSAKNTKDQMDALVDVANRSWTPIENTVLAYKRFDLALRTQGKSQQDVLRITETVNKMLAIGGGEASEAASSLLQLSQAFNKGKLDGDEFRAVMENMPTAMDAVAQYMTKLGTYGNVTRGDLINLSRQGKITATIMSEAFKDASTTVDATFSKLVPTLSRSFAVLSNNSTKAFGELNSATGATAALSNGLLFLANNAKTVILTLSVFGTTLAIFVIPRLLHTAVALYQTSKATNGLMAAMVSNPILLVVAATVALVSQLVLFRNEINAGIDDITTLGDVGRAAGESITESFKESDGTISSFNNNILKGISSWTDAADQFFKTGYEGWAKFLTIGARTIDLLKGMFIGLFIFVGKEILNFIDPREWVSKNDAFFDVGKVWGESMTKGFEIGGSGLTDSMERVLQRAKEMARQAKDAADWKDYLIMPSQIVSKRTFTTGPNTPAMMLDYDNPAIMSVNKVVPEVAKSKGRGKSESRAEIIAKANKELDNQLLLYGKLVDVRKEEVAVQKLQDKLFDSNFKKMGDQEARAYANKVGLVDRMLDVQKELDRLNEVANGNEEKRNATLGAANQLLNEGAITQGQYVNFLRAANRTYRDAVDPMASYNEQLDNQIALVDKSTSQAKVYALVQQIEISTGEKLNQTRKSEVEALVRKQEQLEKMTAVQKAYNDIMANTSTGRQRSLEPQAEGLLKASNQPGFGKSESENAISDAMSQAGLQVSQNGYQQQLDALTDFRATMEHIYSESHNRTLKETEMFHKAMQRADLQGSIIRSSIAADFFQTLEGLGAVHNRKTFYISKAAAIAEATLSMYVAAAKASEKGGVLGGVMDAMARTQGAIRVAQIAAQEPGFEKGGFTGYGATNEVAGVVHRREFVMSAAATSRVGVSDLQALQSGAAVVARRGDEAGEGSRQRPAERAEPPVVNVPLNAIVVSSKEAALAGMRSSEGRNLIIEIIEQNGSTVANIVGANS